MIQETKDLLEKVKAENMVSDKQCVKCVCYIAKYKDDYTLRHFGYGEIKIRPSCSFAGNYGYVSHNPARLCRWYKEKNNGNRRNNSSVNRNYMCNDNNYSIYNF